MKNNIEIREFEMQKSDGTSVKVKAAIDWNIVYRMANRAYKSKGGRCTGGPVTVKVPKK